MEKYLTLGKYSFIKALPYLTPFFIEALNAISGYLGTLSTADPLKNLGLVLVSMAVGDLLRSLISPPKKPIEMVHTFGPVQPDYRIIDATQIR